MVLCGLLGVALAGMPLAIAGAFEPLLALPLMLLVAGVVWWRWELPLAAAGREARLAGIAAVVVVAIVAGVNGRLSAQHLLVERDPGVYTVTAQWLSEHGDLQVATSRDDFGAIPELGYGAPGFNVGGRGNHLEPQFMHFLPAVLAVGGWVGGWDLLMATTAVLGALALLMVYLFAARFMRPAFAIGAMVALGVSLPQVYFSRDSYSEPLVQILLFGGLWALWEATERPSRSGSFMAGLLLGATFTARIDALMALLILSGFLVLGLIHNRARPGAQRTPSHPGLFVAGLVPPAAVAAADLWVIDPFYVEDLSGEVVPLVVGLVVMSVAGALVALRGGVLAPAVAWLGRHRTQVAWILAALTCAVGVYGAVDRPWLVWYLGPVPVVLGFLGLALGWREALVGRDRWPLVAFLMLVLLTATVYLLRPSIANEQIWAVRRLLPVVIPGVLIGAFLLLDLAWTRWRSSAAVARPALVLLSLAVIAFPAARLAPVAGARTQVPMKYLTRSVCDRLPPDASVAVTLGGGAPPIGYTLAGHYTVTLRAFCGVPAAATPIDPAVIERVADAVRKRGRTLVIMSQSEAPFPPRGGKPQALGAVVEELERPQDRPPKLSHKMAIEIFLVPGDQAQLGAAPVD